MSGITVLSANLALERSFAERYGRTMAIRRVWSDQWRDPGEISVDACAADPEMLVIGSDLPREVARQVVVDVDRFHNGTTTVVMSPVTDVDYTIDMLRLGARDVVSGDGDRRAVGARLDQLVELARSRHGQNDPEQGRTRRRIITVVSPKGGTGKTTVATNLAVGLARAKPKQALLIDLDLQFGDCAPVLGLQPEHSIVQAARSAILDRSALKLYLTTHQSGLAVLPPPDDLIAVDDITSDKLKPTIGALAEEFPYVVIDTGAGIDAATLVAMELATDLLMVTTTEIPAILAVCRQLKVLDQIGYTSQRRLLVLNRANAKVGLSVSDVEATIGMDADFRIPNSRVIPISTNEATAVIEKDGGSVARRFSEIVSHFAPPEGQSQRFSFRSNRRAKPDRRADRKDRP